jgi:hypothetical protein
MPRSTYCLDISALSGDPDGGDPFWQSAHVWPIVLTNVACYDMSGNFTYQSGQHDMDFKPAGLAASCGILTAPAIRPPFRLSVPPAAAQSRGDLARAAGTEQGSRRAEAQGFTCGG